MQLLKITMVLVIALSAAALAKTTPRGGKELLRQLVHQTPWDTTRLAHIIKLELHGAVTATDYVPDAFNLLRQLAVEIPREEQVQKLLLWKLTTPQDRQHWLLGTGHNFTLNDFSVPAQEALHNLLLQVDMLIHEGNIPYSNSAPIESYQHLDHQLIALARQQGKKTAPLETSLEARQASLDQQQIIDEQQAQLAERFNAMREMEIEALFIDKISELERSLRLIRAYLHADHATMTELEQQRNTVEKAFDDKLLNTRNRRWIERIVAQCEQDVTCLITAGTAHMTFDSRDTTSIITLLRERVYRVEPSE